MAQVRLDGVRKSYENGYTAVYGITLDVSDGEFLVLVGPSGCGKSTTLRMIAGLETLSGGELRIGDRVVSDVPAKDRDIAMVFQSYALYPHMTVRENLSFGLKLRKLPRAEIDTRVTRAAELLDLGALLDRRPAQLSGGQRQRVALGRALVREPRVFLFDEPLSNLDAKLRVQMRKEIARLHRTVGATTIYVTHDQTEAMTLGDRIAVMNAGRVEQVGTPLELYDAPANRFVAGFIGSPAMNFVPGRVVRDGGALHFAGASGGSRVALGGRWEAAMAGREGRDVVLGVRPEDVSLAADAGSPAAGWTLTVDAVEPMGNETIAYLSEGGSELVARIHPRPVPTPGQAAAVAFSPDRLHFFDAESGESLGRRAAS
jgi:multiple sugar transport system ATP-binding protein